MRIASCNGFCKRVASRNVGGNEFRQLHARVCICIVIIFNAVDGPRRAIEMFQALARVGALTVDHCHVGVINQLHIGG